MKVQLKGFIALAKPDPWDEGHQFRFFTHKMDEHGFATVMPHTLEVELPDDFDPRAKHVEALQAEKTKAMADFQNRMTEIDRQISELTAIEFDGAGV